MSETLDYYRRLAPPDPAIDLYEAMEARAQADVARIVAGVPAQAEDPSEVLTAAMRLADHFATANEDEQLYSRATRYRHAFNWLATREVDVVVLFHLVWSRDNEKDIPLLEEKVNTEYMDYKSRLETFEVLP
jgi:hypothetical protein